MPMHQQNPSSTVEAPSPREETYLREHQDRIERAVAYAIKAAVSDQTAEPLQSVAEHILQFVTEGMAEAPPILATRQEPYSILQMRESSIRDEGDRRSEPPTASMPTASSPTASSPTSAEAA